MSNTEIREVTRAVLDYIEGWYAGDPDRMGRSLHPDLAKRAIVTHPKSGGAIVQHLSAATMIEMTRAGGGKDTSATPGEPEVTVFDVDNGMACARVRSVQYVDYLHLAQVNGEWRIINVLWAPVRPEAKARPEPPGA